MDTLNNLFIINYSKLKYDDYKWSNIETIFDNLLNEIKNEKNIEKIIKKYEYLYLCCVNYIKYIDTFNNDDINKCINFLNKLKYDEKILKKIFKISLTKDINYILKLINPFIINKINNTSIYKIDNCIAVFKKYDDLLNSDVDINKIVNIISVFIFK